MASIGNLGKLYDSLVPRPPLQLWSVHTLCYFFLQCKKESRQVLSGNEANYMYMYMMDRCLTMCTPHLHIWNYM